MEVNERTKKTLELIKSYEKTIFDFGDSEFKPFRKGRTYLEDGFYLTIRCGLGGIYTCLNEWKSGEWQMNILDDSETIAYKKEKINLNILDDERKIEE